MSDDRARTGPGEQGQALDFNAIKVDKNRESKLWNANGYNGWASDIISINRSLKDIRNSE